MYRRGLGATTPQIISGIAAGTTTGASTALATGSDLAGAISGGLLAASPFTGPAAPFVAALGALVGPIAKVFSGCGASCTISTQDANKVAAAMDQVLNLYYRQPVRTASMQQAALAQIQQLIAWLQQACSNPQLGSAGERCISERLTPTGTPPGCITSYGAPISKGDPGYAAGLPCNVYTFYINRIGGDTAVVPDSIVGSLSEAAIPSISGLPSWLIPAALVGAAVWALS